MEKILVFIPNTLDLRKLGYIKGFFKNIDNSQTYYITSDQVSSNISEECIGCISNTNNKPNLKDILIYINATNGKISFYSDRILKTHVVEIMYDYNGLRNSEISDYQDWGVHFKIISNHFRIKKSKLQYKKNVYTFLLSKILLLLDLFLKVLNLSKKLFGYSSIYLHFDNHVHSLRWCLNCLVENKISPKLGTIITSKLIDVILGIIIIHFLIIEEDNILIILKKITEDIVSNLKGLLLYLMGSPIGLKLNYAFNKSLGQFFFYHISLWKIFLYTIQPFFCTYFKYFVLPGVLGFSFHLSMLSDIISVTTFHVYCIYVYAARLFNLQLRGLISLWRLFIGRKYNPLRERVDSCQYSPNQLFIGILGFTVLLFLLPTTVMYYTVFSMFRLVILLVEEILIQVRYILNIIPLYIIILWLFKSSLLAGSFHMTVKKSENKVTKVDMNLDALPLTQCIKNCIPVGQERKRSLGNCFQCILTGTLI